MAMTYADLFTKEELAEKEKGKGDYCDSLITYYYSLPDCQEKKDLRVEITQLTEELNGDC